jgi:hypothetical protein
LPPAFGQISPRQDSTGRLAVLRILKLFDPCFQ